MGFVNFDTAARTFFGGEGESLGPALLNGRIIIVDLILNHSLTVPANFNCLSSWLSHPNFLQFQTASPPLFHYASPKLLFSINERTCVSYPLNFVRYGAPRWLSLHHVLSKDEIWIDLCFN